MNHPGFEFRILARDPKSLARAGVLITPHGEIPTPVFAAVATQGTVKTLAPRDLEELEATLLMANSYHLYLRPGVETIGQFGGLGPFMGWPGPLITDSGGFQVFSLKALRQVDDEGVSFRSHLDGSLHRLTPEAVIGVQEVLRADFILHLDQCPPYPSDRLENKEALRRTILWAQRSKLSRKRTDQALFGILQGGIYPDLRRQAAEAMVELDFLGYAIGGLSVGEPKEVMHEMLEISVPVLPEDRPRHFLGIGSPEDLWECVARGADMFDSALPTRLARNGALFTPQGRIDITNAQFTTDNSPVEEDCDCYTCQNFSRAYLRHLFLAEEILGLRLATLHNLRFIFRLMQKIRNAISEGRFASVSEEFLAQYRPADQGERIRHQIQRLARVRPLPSR